jgi:hypothetical protein
METDKNLERARELVSHWPAWKKEYELTKYSAAALQKKPTNEKVPAQAPQQQDLQHA